MSSTARFLSTMLSVREGVEELGAHVRADIARGDRPERDRLLIGAIENLTDLACRLAADVNDD